MADVSILSRLESYLSLTNQRETVITSNMANVDTPGYRTKDMDFQHELSRAMWQPRTEVNRGRHTVRDVSGLLERPDGNNVDIDREANEAVAGFNCSIRWGTQLMKDRFHQIITAINEDQ